LPVGSSASSTLGDLIAALRREIKLVRLLGTPLARGGSSTPLPRFPVSWQVDSPLQRVRSSAENCYRAPSDTPIGRGSLKPTFR